MNERAVVEKLITLYKERIAENERLRDEGKPYLGAAPTDDVSKAEGPGSAVMRWNILLALQREGLQAAEARLAAMRSGRSSSAPPTG